MSGFERRISESRFQGPFSSDPEVSLSEQETDSGFDFEGTLARAPETEALRGANMPKKKGGLGRGLRALLSAAEVDVKLVSGGLPKEPESSAINTLNNISPSAEIAPAVLSSLPTANPDTGSMTATLSARPIPAHEPENQPAMPFQLLEIDQVTANPNQPRKLFDPAEIASLSQSIKASGLIQPIIVRKQTGASPWEPQFEIVAGERRFRAAKEAGITRIPAIVRELADREVLELGIIENVQRAALSPIEEAEAYRRLIDIFGATQGEVAETIGKDRVSVANSLRLLKLPPELQALIAGGTLSAGHGRALLMAESGELQVELAREIVAGALSVRAAEELVRGALGEGGHSTIRSKKPRKAAKLLDVVAIEDRLRRALGTKVSLKLTDTGHGELRINFFSAAEFETILEKLER